MTAHARARRCPLFAETFDKAASADGRAAPRARSGLHRAVPALGLSAAARLTGMAVVSLWAWYIGRSPRALLATSWDSRWYTGIATQGYGRPVYWPDGAVQSDLAFFPLYPGLIRAVVSALPVTGGTAGLALSGRPRERRPGASTRSSSGSTAAGSRPSSSCCGDCCRTRSSCPWPTPSRC
ncbi:hypothetical protein SCWH03_25660 [Streptomyces pacificus]|uniref:Uncharacterized protein n=1 Tax=Streptomyces pacificus TaxID=2705029 RepID=A0A6A0ATN3_9ACTN|nr:hypothetical protein [Streptomyces pacificus]GFH36339.1 hypothetical protein SCWH03_25660 [Streptomyces pacificus]